MISSHFMLAQSSEAPKRSYPPEDEKHMASCLEEETGYDVEEWIHPKSSGEGDSSNLV